MGFSRKKFVVDKKFQTGLSAKAIIIPLISTLSISAVLLYFAINNYDITNLNNNYITQIVDNQDTLIDMFLSTPALQDADNPKIRDGIKTFNNNIGMLKNISKNSSIITKNSAIVFYFIIIMTIIQAIAIFSLFIFLSHKISGPIFVMRKYLKDLRENRMPAYRSLRKKDELKEFYNDFCDTIRLLSDENRKE